MKTVIAASLVGLFIVGCTGNFDTPETIAVDIYQAINKNDLKTVAKYLPPDAPIGMTSIMDVNMMALYQPMQACGGLKDVTILKREEDQGRITITSSLAFGGRCTTNTIDEMIFKKSGNKFVLDLTRHPNKIRNEIIGKY